MAPFDRTTLRQYAAPFLAATVAALIVDAILQLALSAVRVSSFGGGPPWWITANLIERGRWVVFALLVWWLAPRITVADTDVAGAWTPPAHLGEAWRQVAITVVAVPLLWILATWAVSAVRFTLLGSWEYDGRVFLSPDYYRGLVVDLTPWIMAAAVLLAVRRHLE